MHKKLHLKLQQMLDDSIDAGNPGVILELDAPTRGIHERLSSGLFGLKTNQRLNVGDGFRIASMSKTFTGTIVMQLMEEGTLDIDAPFFDYLQIDDIPMSAGHDAGEITIRMLLNHTSGLCDFAVGRAWGREVRSNPAKFRLPVDTLSWALAHSEPVAAPGVKYNYSDTGYIMLGLLVEKLTREKWGDLCRNRILAPLGMSETWLEAYESPRSTLSHCYVEEYDGLEINGSVDWAAGGHVSTSADLQTFMQALFHGQLFQHLSTLDEMLTAADTADGGGYGAGVRIRPCSGTTLWGHSGFWGSFMGYIPSERITITGTQNRVGANAADLVDAVLTTVLRQQ
jgi:D-alanyl-D-alanine carboxypeptidase